MRRSMLGVALLFALVSCSARRLPPGTPPPEYEPPVVPAWGASSTAAPPDAGATVIGDAGAAVDANGLSEGDLSSATPVR